MYSVTSIKIFFSFIVNNSWWGSIQRKVMKGVKIKTLVKYHVRNI